VIQETEATKLLTTLYSAPTQPELWGKFLAEFARSCGTRKGAIISHDMSTSEHRILAAYGDSITDPDRVRAYETYYYQFDEWTRRAPKASSAPRAWLGIEIWPDDQFQMSTFHNEFLKALDVCELAALSSRAHKAVLETLSFYRGPDEIPFGVEQVRALQWLAPHLETALGIHRQLAALESRVSDLETLLDQLGTGIVLVGAQGNTVFANQFARRICSAQCQLRISSNGLSAQNSEENHRLRTLIAKAISIGAKKTIDPAGAMTIQRDQMRPLHLLVAPFFSSRLQFSSRTVAVVLISDPESPSTLQSDIARELYGLTAAEARLAMTILEGKSLVQTADLIGVTHETARSQMKSILQKTGTTRQGELIRLFSAFPCRNS
jgi:DNA-binding CsgD family transcriptional regulator/PAS domain-containing protein